MKPHQPRFAAVAFALSLAMGSGGAAAAASQRSAPTPLDEAEVLDDFAHIVDLIWTDEERAAWEQLDADEQKRAFIEAFWLRRDPTVGTDVNEFREVYMGRVAAAAASFDNEGMPGYRTDRGKVLIIYGANALLAQETRQIAGDPGVGTGDEDVGGRAQQPADRQVVYLWTMDPSINPHLREAPRLRFEPSQGAYLLADRGLELSQEAFLANRDVSELFAARRAEERSPFADPSGGPPDPKDEALRSLLEEGVERGELTLDYDFSFFPAPGGNTYTVLAFEVGTAARAFGDGNVEVFGLILRDGPEAEAAAVHRIDAILSIDEEERSAGESATYTVGVTVPPGAFRAALGVIEAQSGRIGTVTAPVEVPSFTSSSGFSASSTGELTLTSVARAKAPLRRTEEPIDVDHVYDVMRIGPLVLDVDVDNVFERNDTISLLYFVMGAAVDSGSGEPRFQVTHRILRAADNQSIARLTDRTLSSTMVTQDVPLAAVDRLQEGADYAIQIHVQDLISGRELYHAVPFTVSAGGS